jgi:hypothetical protein
MATTAEAVIADNAEAIMNAKPAPYLRVKTMSTLLDAIDQGKRKSLLSVYPAKSSSTKDAANPAAGNA